MPYTARKTEKGYTISKKNGGVVGHTGKTEKQKNAYMAALNINSKDKPKKESIEGAIEKLFVVKKPYAGCTLTSLVEPIDPLLGIGAGHSIVPDQVHGVFPSQEVASKVANSLYEEYCKTEALLEKKKEEVTKKLKSALDELEKQRSNSMKMIKENPKDTVNHKDKVANLTHKIDDLMTKLEKIEKSKKEIEVKKDDKKEEKKSLKEGALNNFKQNIKRFKAGNIVDTQLKTFYNALKQEDKDKIKADYSNDEEVAKVLSIPKPKTPNKK